MDINKFVEKFAEQFDDTAMEMFKPETKFRDLEEWDSLSSLSVIAMIDEEFDIIITGADLRSAATIQELFELVTARK